MSSTMEQNGAPTRVGMEYILDHERVNYTDGDLVILDSIASLQSAGTKEMEMILIVICEEGALKADHNGNPITVSAKDMLICPPGVMLDNIFTSPDFKAVIFGMSYEKFQKTVLSGMDIWTLLLFATRHPVFHLLDIDLDLTEGYFLVVKKKFQTSKEFYYKEIMHAIMEAIFYEICVVINREITPGVISNEGSQSEQIFRKFIEAIGKYGFKERSVGFYAQELCISPKYLSSVTRAVSGKPALEWILEHCTDGIVHELKYSNKSIKEIANDFNFPTISSFGKFVKKRLGVSPRTYRKSHE